MCRPDDVFTSRALSPISIALASTALMPPLIHRLSITKHLQICTPRPGHSGETADGRLHTHSTGKMRAADRSLWLIGCRIRAPDPIIIWRGGNKTHRSALRPRRACFVHASPGKKLTLHFPDGWPLRRIWLAETVPFRKHYHPDCR